ncbi:MAG: hypothetical protein ACUVX8_14760 [Candidatus Zipacnadales bacterium]
MSTTDYELEPSLEEDVVDRPPPQLVPTGWRLFFVLLAGFDIVCFLLGRVPWTGERHGLDRLDTLLVLVVGVGLGGVIGLLAEAIAASRATAIGLSPAEMALAADELSILTRPPRPTRLSIVPLVAAVLIACTLVARIAFAEASLPAVTVFFALHVLTGLAIPVLVRSYRRAHDEFQVWLDEKNAPFDAEAAKRVALHRTRVAEIITKIRATEDELRSRLDQMPRVAPPCYLQPLLMWVPFGLAVLLDFLLLASPATRDAALGSQGMNWWTLLWRIIVLWVQSCVLMGIVWALLSWYYVDIADQASRQWRGRDWSGGPSAIAIELVYGGVALAFAISLLLGWGARFATWNALAATPLLVGVLTDIRNTAAEHYQRSVRDRTTEAGPPPTPPAPSAND